MVLGVGLGWLTVGLVKESALAQIMLDYGMLLCLILILLSHLILQFHCYNIRNNIPTVSEQFNGKSETLLSTVDEGVQILADLADILDSNPLEVNAENITSSPLMQLLTSYLIPRMNMQQINGSENEEWAVRQENHNTQEEQISESA